MKLSTVLRPALIKVGLDAIRCDEVIGEVLDLLVQYHEVPYAKRDDVLNDLLAHEQVAPSGKQNGVGIPLATTEHVESLLCALGTSVNGIPHDLIDGSLCRIVLLILVPPHDIEGRIHTLEAAANLFARQDVRDRLIRARSPEEAHQVILDAEADSESRN